MTAILTKGKTTITGKIIVRGLGKITLVVINKDGGKSIKRYSEEIYTVTVF